MRMGSSQQNLSQHPGTLFLGQRTLDTKLCPSGEYISPACLVSITVTEDRQAGEEHKFPHSSHELPFVPLFSPQHKRFYPLLPTKSN